MSGIWRLMKSLICTNKMTLEGFHRFLDNTINLSEFEEWIYNNAELEHLIGEENYQLFLEFNYHKKLAEADIQNLIFRNILTEKEFSTWKVNALLESIDVEFPADNLFSYAKQNRGFLGGKVLGFKHYWDKEEIEIFWASKVSWYLGHYPKKNQDNKEFLYLGTYDRSYQHLLLNKESEIWLANDIVPGEDFFANSLREAIAKLFILRYGENEI